MVKLHFKKNHASFTLLLVALIFVSCNLRQEFIAEEIVAVKRQAEEVDSLMAQIKDLNNRGTTARNNADYQEALNLHFKALSLAETVNDTVGQLYSLNNIGTDLRRTYSNIEASTYHYLALELSGDDSKYSKNRAMAMNGLGNIFLALNKPDQAQTYFQGAL